MDEASETRTPVRLSSDAAALVNPANKWKRIVKGVTPTGAKLLLCNREAGVLTHGTLGTNTWFTHYCELPVFDDDDEDEGGEL